MNETPMVESIQQQAEAKVVPEALMEPIEREAAAAAAAAPAVRRPLTMADTVKPWMIPASWEGAVMAYRDGFYEWPWPEVARFSRACGISVTGNPAEAARARALDVERFDATPAEAPRFCDARAELGHKDATCYCSRDVLPELIRQLGDRQPRLHIATLDDYPWSPAELAAQIEGSLGLVIDPARIWAIQCYRARPAAGIFYDTSLVHGELDFWNPAGLERFAG